MYSTISLDGRFYALFRLLVVSECAFFRFKCRVVLKVYFALNVLRAADKEQFI